MIISILAAVSENGMIGVDNRLPWKLSDDLKYFKAKTFGKYIIMGRKTFDSIGKPLKGRTNIILTRNKSIQIEGAIIMHTLIAAVEYAKNQNQDEIFIVGGADIYKQSVPLSHKIYLTRVAARLEGDAFFPELNWNEWKIKSKTDFSKNDKNDYGFQILELERK